MASMNPAMVPEDTSLADATGAIEQQQDQHPQQQQRPSPDTTTTTTTTLTALVQWHTSPHNPSRPGKPLRRETAEGHVRRLRAFGTSLESLEDPHGRTLMNFLDRMLEDGKSSGTRRLCCDGVLFYLKFAHSNASQEEDRTKSERLERAMAATRRVRNALQAQYATELKARSDRTSMEEDGKWCDWPTIVKATHAVVSHWRTMQRALKDDQEDSDAEFDVRQAKSGQSLARRTALAGQAALLALMYTAMPPSRGLELRTLELRAPEKIDATTAEKNWLGFNKEGDPTLRLGRYKTVGLHGTQTIPLPTTKDFRDALAFVTTTSSMRKLLLQRASEHGVIFCHPSTGAKMGSDSWSSYVVQVFKQGLEMSGYSNSATCHVSVNVLRKAFLTHALPNATTVPERESLAAAMRHSTKTQTQSYNAATASDRVKEACSVAQSMFLMGKEEESEDESSASGGEHLETTADDDDDDDMDSAEFVTAANAEGDDDDDDDIGIEEQAVSFSSSSASGEQESPTLGNINDKVELDDDEVEEEEGIVTRLLALRRRKPDGRVQYLVRWADRTTFQDSWEDEARLPTACVREYYEQGVRVKRKKQKQKEVVTSKDSAQVAAASVGSKRRRISSKARGAVHSTAKASMHGSSGTCSTSSATAASLSAGVKSHRDMTLRGDDDDDWMP